ncbi:unnamed protein product [Caenorhabditis brenneri]
MCTGIQCLFIFLSISFLVSGQESFENTSDVEAKQAAEHHFTMFDTAMKARDKDAIFKMFELTNSTETSEKLDYLFKYYINVKLTVKSAWFMDLSSNTIKATVILSRGSRNLSQMSMKLQKCSKSPSGWQAVRVNETTTGRLQRKIPYISCVLGPLACFIELYVRTLNGN